MKFSFIFLLSLAVAFPCTASQKPITSNDCALIKALISRKDINELAGYMLPYEEPVSGDDRFQDIDIDGDGFKDTITRSSGYGNGNIQTLIITLHNKEEIVKEMEPFFLIMWKGSVLAVEMYRNIYLVNNKSVNFICNSK